MPVIPDTIRINVQWAREGVLTAINALHARVALPTVVNESYAASVGAAIRLAIDDVNLTSGPSAFLQSDWSYEGVTVRDLRTPNLPEFTGGAPLTGTFTGNGLPSSNAICVTLRTAFAGRSFRGRVYLPGWATTAVTTTGNIAVGAQTAANDVVEGWQTDLAAIGATLAVASPTLGVSNPVTAIGVRDGQWDTQRRRNVPGV